MKDLAIHPSSEVSAGQLTELSQLSYRTRLQSLQGELLKLPQLKLSVYHHFPMRGMYVRELHIPKGALTIGKIHKFGCWNILAQGERSTLVDGQIERIRAPHWHWSMPGSKRISYTHEDAVWITIHQTMTQDIATLEKELVAETEEEYEQFVRFLSMEVISACPS